MSNARAAGGFARFRSGRRRIAIGPGAIATASDNDPTTVGSLAVVVTAAWVAFLARTNTGGGRDEGTVGRASPWGRRAA
jgi:hypothetical protein